MDLNSSFSGNVSSTSVMDTTTGSQITSLDLNTTLPSNLPGNASWTSVASASTTSVPDVNFTLTGNVTSLTSLVNTSAQTTPLDVTSGVPSDNVSTTSYLADNTTATTYLDVNTTSYDNDNGTVGEIYIEDYHIGIKLGFSIVGAISVLACFVAITALRRTKKIPPNAKFLSTALLMFDSMFITMSMVRKFILEPGVNTNINVAANASLQLAYMTVAMMALERFCIFYRPMIYMRIATASRVKLIAACAWMILVSSFAFVRYGVCFIKFGSEMFSVAGVCNQIVTFYYSALVFIVLATSMVCYSNIFKIVREKVRSDNKRNQGNSVNSVIGMMKSFKTTSLVFIYIGVIFTTSFAYAMIILYIRLTRPNITLLRLSLELVSTINCVLDPFLYVLWFRESQMEVLKMLAPCNSRIKQKTLRMKFDIFNIVTSRDTGSSNLSLSSSSNNSGGTDSTSGSTCSLK